MYFPAWMRSLFSGDKRAEENCRLKQQTSGVVLEEASQEEGLQAGTKQEGVKKGHWNFSVGTSFSYMKAMVRG